MTGSIEAPDLQQAAWSVPAAAFTAGACSLLVSASAALAAVPPTPPPAVPATANQVHYQQQQQHSLASLQAYSAVPAPSLLASTTQLPDAQQQWVQEQQQHASAQELQQLAQWDWPRNHWLATVLFIGAINILGLQAVLKVLQASRDSSTPVTVLVVRMGLRVDNKSNKLQERLRFLRDMMGVEHAAFFTFEEAMQAICNPPRGCQLAYADLEAFPLSSKQAGYDLFKQKAVVEQVRAARVEEADVLHGSKPNGPNHRNMLQKLLGAAETEDAEEAQACLLVTLVVLSKGTVAMQQQPLRDAGAFKDAMKSLCGHLKVGQLLALELLLTPDSPQDFLSEAQLMTDYSFLTDLSSGLRIDHPDWSPVPSPFASADDYGGSGQLAAEAAAAAMAAMAADAAGAEGAASAAAATLRDDRAVSG